MSKTYKTHLLTFTAAFAGLFATSQASAALVVYDGFEYDISDSAALSGKGSAGNGWVGSWAINGSGATIVEDNMSYSAGSIHINGGNQAVRIANNNDALFTRQFQTIGNTTGEDVYFSFLFKEVSGTPSSSNGDWLNFWVSEDADRANSGGIGKTSGPRYLGAAATNANSNDRYYTQASSEFNQGETYFLVGRISRDGSTTAGENGFDRVELWINPTSTDLGEADVIADYNISIDDETGFSFFGLRTVNISGTDDYRFDELRIGTDIASVVAVPEPSTYALLFGFVALLSMIIRRRNR